MVDEAPPLTWPVEKLIENWPSEPFDSLVKISADLLEMPVVWIGLITPSRLLLPVCLGLPLQEIELTDSFCLQTFAQVDPLIVNDTQSDIRLDHLSLATEPYHLRFYAGVPLFSTAGTVIGTLSVMDKRPREFEARDLRCLQLLARQVQDALIRVCENITSPDNQPNPAEAQEAYDQKILARPPRRFRLGTRLERVGPDWRPLGTLAAPSGFESQALQRFYTAQAQLQRMTLETSLLETEYEAGLTVLCDYFKLPQAALLKVNNSGYELLNLSGAEILPEEAITSWRPFLESVCEAQDVVTLDGFWANYQLGPEYLKLPKVLIGAPLWLSETVKAVVICSGPEIRPHPFSPLELDFMRLFGRWLGFMSQRRASLAHLKAINDKKDHVLAMVAHDLRNPLGTIVSASRMLARSQTEGLNARMLKVIDQACLLGNQLIDELLEAAELEETSSLDLHSVNLCRFVQSIFAQFEPRVKLKGIELILEQEAEAVFVKMHELKLRRVFENLLNNALKFTPAGGVIGLRLSQTQTKAYIQIEDTGIGIPFDLQQELFEKYSQARRQGLAGEASHGLGMYIVKQITELHGGRIQVASLEGQGTVFQIELPLAPAPSFRPPSECTVSQISAV